MRMKPCFGLALVAALWLAVGAWAAEQATAEPSGYMLLLDTGRYHLGDGVFNRYAADGSLLSHEVAGWKYSFPFRVGRGGVVSIIIGNVIGVDSGSTLQIYFNRKAGGTVYLERVEDAAVAENVWRQAAPALLHVFRADDGNRHRQPGDIEGLGGGGDRQGATRDLGRQARERNMALTVVGELGVNLVADDHEIVAQNDLGDAFELFAIQDTAGRVVRIAEKEHSGVRIDHRTQVIPVDLVALRATNQRTLRTAPATAVDGAVEGSYGRTGGDVERLQGVASCLPQAIGICP